ncbi:DivIVA domain-containing protein [Intestinimonas aquisgranensis]|uniref:DivIVA domain-containing protein n=1 Tax=Intestinimonas timonensis TaxID=1689270 RepID=UPI001031596A|nr:DivIVA domain-containing protein [Intestinimonas timonensis]MCC2257494.1 DivIVA domain-containing protein [Intestinimonas aquisgranensis]
MLTPQEVSEHAFAKAGFGGYNMAMVDEFLDQLTEDYTTLYKENAVLKSKMKVLVDKVEEYRSTEEAMRKTLLTAQRMADEIVKEAQASKDTLVHQAEEEARARVQGLRREVEAEQLRLTAAQNATAAYVAKLKELYQHELDYLGSLSKLTPESAAPADPVDAAAEEIQATMDRIAQEEVPAPAQAEEEDDDIPQEDERPGGLYSDLTATFVDRDGETERKIKVNPERRAAEMAEAKEPVDDEPTKRLSIDLEHLQFGKDYEIK